ncbi:MAG: hypothetical protein V3V26_02455 [Candidatus Aenigmarchaeota archaeon]
MPKEEIPSERLPLLHVVHYQIPLDEGESYNPEVFGGRMRQLDEPMLDVDPDRTPYRINIASFLYKLLMRVGAESLEGDLNLTYWPVGSQDHYNKFIERHTLREGWDWHSMESALSWKFPGGKNPVCVISKYDGRNTGERDEWYLFEDTKKKKLKRIYKKGFTLGCNKHDWEGFREQFWKFDSMLYPVMVEIMETLDIALGREGSMTAEFDRKMLKR